MNSPFIIVQIRVKMNGIKVLADAGMYVFLTTLYLAVYIVVKSSFITYK